MARLFFYVCLIGLFNTTSVFCQTSTDLTTSDEYRRIGQFMRQKDYGQAIAESRNLIERAPSFEHAYEKLAQAALASEKLIESKTWLESRLQPPGPADAAYFGLAQIAEKKRDYTSAIENYRQYLRAVPHSELAIVNLVRMYERAKRIVEAEAYLKAQLADHRDNPAIHLGLGYYFIKTEKTEDAIRELDLALSLNPRTTDAHYYKLLAWWSIQRYGKVLEAIEYHLLAFESDPDKERQRANLAFIGGVFRDVGKYSEALAALERASALAQEFGDLAAEGNYASQMGALWSRQDNYQQALLLYRRSMEIADELGTNTGRQLGDIGWIHFLLGNFTVAIESYDKALELAVKGRDTANESRLLMNMGMLLVAEDKPDQAITKYDQALKIANANSNIATQIGCLNALGSLYVQSGDYEKALSSLQLALKLSREIATPLPEATALNNLGELQLRLNQPQLALEFFEQARNTAVSINNPRNVWRAYAGLAATYEKLNQLQQAQTHNRLAIEVMEGVRARLTGEEQKAGFLQDKIAIYKRQLALLLADNAPRYSEVFHYAERARARAFLDLLAEAKVSGEQNIDPELLKRDKELQQRVSHLTVQLIKERSRETSKQDKVRIGELEKGLAQADAELGNWLRELRQRNPRYAALKYPEPVKLEQVQHMLDDKTVLLSYSLAEPASFLLAVTHNDFQVKRLTSESTLRVRVQKLLKSITDKNYPDAEGYRREASLLSRELLQPVRQMLIGKKALVIVPDGPLHRLPFEALFFPGGASRGDLRQLPYLIKRFAISYSPSASVLAELRNQKREAAPKGFIAFGDPVYELTPESVITSTLRSPGEERLNFQRLQYSRTEVQGIAQLFANDDQQVFLGAAANEETVKGSERLRQYRLVHFSTHGYIDEARPRFSGLVLSLTANNPQAEDGLLSAYEIFNLKLNADLVVLSACDTGLGKEIRGEGLMSLMRAFMYAGTSSVVVSLWNVNDESASDLMVRFYRHLKKDGMSKSEALRQAQLETIHDNGFPFFWAPFVLVGKP
jgi:CHAT domain-containing protein/tetratricopeptide (TPR) repeat protein